MTQIYTNPRYLKNSWQDMYRLLETGVPNQPIDTLTLGQFQAQLNGLPWDDNLTSFLHLLARESTTSKKVRVALFCHELLGHSGQELNIVYKTPDDDNGRFFAEFIFEVKDFDTWTNMPIGSCLREVGRGNASPVVSINRSARRLQSKDPETAGKVEYNIWNLYYSQKALELAITDCAVLVEETRELLLDAEDFSLEKALESFAASSKEEIADTLAEAVFPRNHQSLFSGMMDMLRLRIVLIMNMCALCEDRQGALEWSCSADGPFFSGPDAAELNRALDTLWKPAENMPDLFERASAESTEH